MVSCKGLKTVLKIRSNTRCVNNAKRFYVKLNKQPFSNNNNNLYLIVPYTRYNNYYAYNKTINKVYLRMLNLNESLRSCYNLLLILLNHLL